MKIVIIAMQEAEIKDPEVIQDSEQQCLPSPGHAIESTCTLFTPEEMEDNKASNLEEIIVSCLKEAKRNNMTYAIKCLSHLVTVSEYVKLHACYQNTKASKHPCLSASIAIARQMGKGPYFAYQIWHNELYLLWCCQLPPPKLYTRHGHHSLLDNELLLHNVCTYLASQALGTVTPLNFCRHVNTAILLALGINATILESTALCWLKFKLGYQSKEAKKGVYVDGHEHPDIIKEREGFLEEIFDKFERYVTCVECPKDQVSDVCMLIKSYGFL